MCAPIESGDETLGVLYSDSPAGELVPDEELESLFEGIAAQAGLSLSEAGEHVRGVVDDSLEEAFSAVSTRSSLPGLPPTNASIEELEYRCTEMRKLAVGLARDTARLTGQLTQALDVCIAPGANAETVAVARRVTTSLANRLTTLARVHKLALDLEMGTVDLQSDEVDVAKHLEAMNVRLRDEARLGRVELGFSSLEQYSVAVVDREVLGLVIDTLISLAVYFSSPGGTVTLGCLQDGATIEVAIHESGCGRSADERMRLIMAWANAAVPDAAELGALLTFCRLAVKAQGGRLELTGDRDRTAWLVSLPSTGADDGDETQVTRASPEILELRKRLSGR